MFNPTSAYVFMLKSCNALIGGYFCYLFSRLSKKYKTLLSNEVVIEQDINDLENTVVQNLNNVDKHHLELQNQILGLNSNK